MFARARISRHRALQPPRLGNDGPEHRGSGFACQRRRGSNRTPRPSLPGVGCPRAWRRRPPRSPTSTDRKKPSPIQARRNAAPAVVGSPVSSRPPPPPTTPPKRAFHRAMTARAPSPSDTPKRRGANEKHAGLTTSTPPPPRRHQIHPATDPYSGCRLPPARSRVAPAPPPTPSAAPLRAPARAERSRSPTRDREPYPSTCVVAGMSGTITDLNLTMTGLSHTYPDDIDILLVRPGASANATVMSDAGGSLDVSAVNLTLDDEAPAPLPDRPRSRPAATSRPTTRVPTHSRHRHRHRRATSTCRPSTAALPTAPGACTWSTTRRSTWATSPAGR